MSEEDSVSERDGDGSDGKQHSFKSVLFPNVPLRLARLEVCCSGWGFLEFPNSSE
jgi:hypothetical protein